MLLLYLHFHSLSRMDAYLSFSLDILSKQPFMLEWKLAAIHLALVCLLWATVSSNALKSWLHRHCPVKYIFGSFSKMTPLVSSGLTLSRCRVFTRTHETLQFVLTSAMVLRLKALHRSHGHKYRVDLPLVRQYAW